MKKIYCIIKTLSLITILFVFIYQVNYRKNINKLENQIKYVFKETLFYSLEKDDDFYINKNLFEDKIKNVILIVIKNNKINNYSVDIGYVINNKKCKGVNLCLNYKIKVVPQKIIISYILKE